MKTPAIPRRVRWSNGMVLEPEHFERSDVRAGQLARLAALAGDPWPWGYTRCEIDETALVSGSLRVQCEGILPDGTVFERETLTRRLPEAATGASVTFSLQGVDDAGKTNFVLTPNQPAPADRALPVARLVERSGVWGQELEWSPPALLIGDEHPLRNDAAARLGALAALGAGFLTTLRMPGAEERAAARRLGQVALELVQGVGIMESLLRAPIVAPGRLALEATRLTLGVRGAAGVFEPLAHEWDPGDQRGSLRRILHAAESTATALGLPFRAIVLRRDDATGMFVAKGLPTGPLLLGVEASRPADLTMAKGWLEGAAIAAPGRIDEALNRRVVGCARQPVQRDPQIGVASGPLLALYQVGDDMSWRGGERTLALGTRSSSPPNVSFLIFVAEDGPEPVEETESVPHPWLDSTRPTWAGGGP